MPACAEALAPAEFGDQLEQIIWVLVCTLLPEPPGCGPSTGVYSLAPAWAFPWKDLGLKEGKFISPSMEEGGTGRQISYSHLATPELCPADTVQRGAKPRLAGVLL